MAGLVLAGGRSVRFGGEKAVATLKGTPLLRLALDRLEVSCASVAVSASPSSLAALLAEGWGVQLLNDPPGAPRGPLSGLCAGLAWAQSLGFQRLAVLPCDLPFAPFDLFERLGVWLGDGDGAAVARTSDGLQSLCLIAHTGLHATLAALIADGDHPPVHEWLGSVGAREVRFDDASAFANINTPQDLARAEASA
jgi:molybdopterin-guanine dinucleotide biosynthesis protein A